MKLQLFAAAVLLLILSAWGCTTTTHHHHYDQDDDGPATLDDLDDVRVYRPGDNGRGDPEHSDSDPEPEVEVPPSDPEPQPDPEPIPPESEPDPVVEDPPEDPVVEQPEDDPEADPAPEPGPVTGPDHDELADAFIAEVKSRLSELKATKAWKAYSKAIEEFDKRYDKAKEKRGNDKGKDLEQAWATAIKAWYEARYLQALFLHLNEGPEGFEPVFVHERDEVLSLDDEHLQSEACINAQAASELVASRSSDLMKFYTDAIKYDRTAADVYADKKWEKRWEDEKQMWQDAANGNFDEKDIRKYSE